ncbi:MAG: zinc ribbon domain-containing protein [Candidatus Riflebacteria bacterium]|nr:zinc ribbon domain-containing protein [Candidatus Riflebacteria bacterium]
MPTYSYLCDKCEKKFDAFHSMHCTDPQLCPTCGHPGRKLLSASSIIYRGSGFYTTDYRDSGYVEAQKRDDTNGSGSSSPKTGSGNGGPSAATAPKAEPSAPAKEPTGGGPTGSSGSTGGGSTPPPAKSASPRAVVPQAA